MIKKVLKFQTEDGTEFDNEIDAKLHEVETEAIKKLVEMFDATIRGGNSTRIAKHMLTERSDLRAVLAMYDRKLPKKKIAA